MDIPPSSLRLRFEPAPSILRTEAIVLRIHPFSHTSQMAIWLTEEGRRLATPVKGAARPKSAFLGQFDLFYTCELLYYARSRDGVHVPRECEPRRRRDRLRTNWRAAQCASWFASLADLVSDAGAAFPGLYRLLDETLDVLDAAEGAPPPALFARFEAKLLAEAGLRPNFGAAEDAGEGPGGPLRFNLADGRPATDGAGGLEPVVRIPRDAVALYDELAESPSVGPGSTYARTEPAATAALLRFLGLFLRYHLPDALVEGRAVALAALRD